jgi:hypothetical protein
VVVALWVSVLAVGGKGVPVPGAGLQRYLIVLMYLVALLLVWIVRRADVFAHRLGRAVICQYGLPSCCSDDHSG